MTLQGISINHPYDTTYHVSRIPCECAFSHRETHLLSGPPQHRQLYSDKIGSEERHEGDAQLMGQGMGAGWEAIVVE